MQEMAVHMAVAYDVFGGDSICVVFPRRVYRMESGIELCQLLRTFRVIFCIIRIEFSDFINDFENTLIYIA